MSNGWWQKWRRFHKRLNGVLSMNQRNLLYIYPNNRRRDFPLADNKLHTKRLLADTGITVPATYAVFDSFYSVKRIGEKLSAFDDFVIKPAQGSGGGGIVVVSGKDSGGWHTAGGRVMAIEDIRKHITDILFGVHSFGLNDQALVEERLVQHGQLQPYSPFGLTDVRLIVHRNLPVMAMMRVPSKRSAGKANLHQGAIGVGVDLRTGRTCHAILENKAVRCHPDTGADLLDFQIPHWDALVQCGRKTAACLPLKYVGVDIAVTEQGPVVLEVNARPGIAIQNANARGLREVLASTREQPL